MRPGSYTPPVARSPPAFPVQRGMKRQISRMEMSRVLRIPAMVRPSGTFMQKKPRIRQKKPEDSGNRGMKCAPFQQEGDIPKNPPSPNEMYLSGGSTPARCTCSRTVPKAVTGNRSPGSGRSPGSLAGIRSWPDNGWPKVQSSRGTPTCTGRPAASSPGR
jgi:hypothetical protein